MQCQILCGSGGVRDGGGDSNLGGGRNFHCSARFRKLLSRRGRDRGAGIRVIAGDTTGSLSDARELVYASQDWLSARYQADAPVWGRFDPERWNGFYAWLYQNGLMSHDLTGLGFTNDYLPEE